VLTVTDGTTAGIQRNIISYDPNTYFLGLDAGPSVGSVAGQGYRIDWPKFSDTQGFKVESALDANGAPGAFVEIAKQTGFHLERDGGDQGGTWWYRFTPYNVNGVENRVARIVKRVVVSGDLVAPTAPFLVTSTASLQLVTVYVFMNNVPLDFAGVDIEVYQFQFVNGQRQIIQILGADQVAAPQSFGNATIQHAFDIRWAGLSYANTFLYARARSKDWTGNVSAWVQGNDFTFEQVNTLDLGDTSVTIKSTYIDASTMTLATSAETVVGTITITTEGYPIQFASRVTMQHFLAGAALHLRLRRDNAGGTLLDEVLAYANETTTPTTLRGIFALDQRPPGTYVYVMTVIAESSLSPNFSVWDRYLSSVEIKR